MNPSRSHHALHRLVVACVAAALAGLGGCSYMPKTPTVDFTDTPQPPRPAAPVSRAQLPSNGSLFHASTFRPGFEDRRARLVGDSITIQITENVSASQKSTSTVDRSGALDGSVSAFPFLKSNTTDKLTLGAKSSNVFSGKGGTESANTFSGTITATVIDVLPNGHLVLAGDKQIGVNQNVDVLRFSGTVDPKVIQAGNVVASTQVANARIESRGRGQQNEAQVMGWLSRIFMSVLPF